MNDSKKLILIYFVFFCILISCSNGFSVTEVSIQKPSVVPSLSVVASVTQSLRPTVNPTNVNFRIPFPIHVTPDKFEYIYNDTKQISDGSIKLHLINNNENSCYKNHQYVDVGNGKFSIEFGEPAPLVLKFENLTEEEIQIIDYVYINSPSNIFMEGRARLTPILYTLEGQRIREAVEFYSVPFLIYPTLSPPVVQTIPAKSTFQMEINYLPPILGVAYLDELGEIKYSDFPAGEYLIKYVYFSNNNDNMWNGLVSSNLVKICFMID